VLRTTGLKTGHCAAQIGQEGRLPVRPGHGRGRDANDRAPRHKSVGAGLLLRQLPQGSGCEARKGAGAGSQPLGPTEPQAARNAPSGWDGTSTRSLPNRGGVKKKTGGSAFALRPDVFL
jgi:hypothetical protein